MMRLVHAAQPLARDVRVDLRRREVGVTEHHLHGAKIRAAFQKMGRKAVTKDVG
jgi:hypothetical protein